MAALFPILVFGCPTLMMLLRRVLFRSEFRTTRRLRKHGESIEGQLEWVDLKSTRPGGVYGKIGFTYRVHEKTYAKKQTVDKDTAMALLSGRTAFPLFSKPTKVTVLVLPKRPALARLAMAPSDRVRIVIFVVALIVLGFIVALMLVVLLATTNTQPNY